MKTSVMPLVAVRFHHSQFPDAVRRDLIESLRSCKVNHKFHYDSIKQAHKWLALHESYSPARTDPDCVKIYDKSFQFAGEKIGKTSLHLIGLGCGGGHKEAQLLEIFSTRGKQVHFTASDVSPALVIVAHQRAAKIIGEKNCDALVCDLQNAADLPQVFEELGLTDHRRMITFFGLIPNFEPQEILAKLSAILRPDDLLLFSANLAPGPDYQAGVERIFRLYDNQMTREWLMVLLQDLGVEKNDGEMRFRIEEVDGLKRITATFHFTRACELGVYGQVVRFGAGESIRLFFSYRHTVETVRSLLAQEQIEVMEQWVTGSGEEGVFLCQKQAIPATL